VSPSILEVIQQENLSFWHTKTIFCPIYYGFLTDSVLPGAAQVLESTTKCAASGNTLSMLELILSIVFGTFSEARTIKHVQKWTAWVVDRMRRQPALAIWLLQLLCFSTGAPETTVKKKWLCALLLDSADADIRLCGKKIVSVALVIVSSSTQLVDSVDSSPLVSTDVETLDQSAGSAALSLPQLSQGEDLCMRVVDGLVRHLLRDAQLQWRNIHTFFSPISVLAKNSPACRFAMQSRDYLASLLSLFLRQDTPCPQLVGGEEPGSHKSRCMGEGHATADFSSLLVAVVALLPSTASSSGSGSGTGTERDADIFVDSKSEEAASKEEIKTITVQTSSDEEKKAVVSSKSFGMMRSSIFMYKLLSVLQLPDNKPSVSKILDFVLRDSKELTETCVQILISAMKKEDGIGLKAPLRCAMLLCKIGDSLKGWRISHVLQQTIVEIKNNLQYVQATDVSITMFLRICKHSQVAAEWLRLNYNARLTWLESYLITRKGGMIPLKSFAWKPIKASSNGGSTVVNDKSALAMTAAANAVKVQAELNLQLIKRILNASHSTSKDTVKHGGKSTKNQSAPPVAKFSRISIVSGGYDSDDDPMDLVGIRVQVQWKSIFYPGQVVSFDERSGQHMIHYDDGDKQACALGTKVWSVID
jgi:hypothetical protein